MPRLIRVTPRLCKVRKQAVVYLSGEAHYLGRYGSPEAKRRFRQVVSEWEAANRPTQPQPSPADITVGELCLTYRDHAAAYYRTIDGVASGEIHPIKAAIKALRTVYVMTLAAEFGPLAFKALRNEWISQGLSRRTVNRYADRIKRISKSVCFGRGQAMHSAARIDRAILARQNERHVTPRPVRLQGRL